MSLDYLLGEVMQLSEGQLRESVQSATLLMSLDVVRPAKTDIS